MYDFYVQNLNTRKNHFQNLEIKPKQIIQMKLKKYFRKKLVMTTIIYGKKQQLFKSAKKDGIMGKTTKEKLGNDLVMDHYEKRYCGKRYVLDRFGKGAY